MVVGNLYLVVSWQLVIGSLQLVIASWHLVLCSCQLVVGFCHLVICCRQLVDGSWQLVVGNWLFEIGIWLFAPFTEFSRPDHGLSLDPGMKGGYSLEYPLRLHFNLTNKLD